MTSRHLALAILALLIVALAAGVAVMVWRRPTPIPPAPAHAAPAPTEPAPVAAWLADRRFHVHARVGGRWVEAVAPQELAGAPWFAVTYDTRELAALVGPGAHPPLGTRDVIVGDLPIPELPSDAELTAGLRRVAVAVEPSPLLPEHWRVILTNRGARAVRVRWFGAWTLQGGAWVFSTISGRPFTPEQFRAWYGVADPEGWVLPGATVDDPINFGGGRWVWAFEEQGGDAFAVGWAGAG
ncbi:MAG: hypothetical protein ABIO70_21205 [Pseudomonadota bacterium]